MGLQDAQHCKGGTIAMKFVLALFALLALSSCSGAEEEHVQSPDMPTSTNEGDVFEEDVATPDLEGLDMIEPDATVSSTSEVNGFEEGECPEAIITEPPSPSICGDGICSPGEEATCNISEPDCFCYGDEECAQNHYCHQGPDSLEGTCRPCNGPIYEWYEDCDLDGLLDEDRPPISVSCTFPLGYPCAVGNKCDGEMPR